MQPPDYHSYNPDMAVNAYYPVYTHDGVPGITQISTFYT